MAVIAINATTNWYSGAWAFENVIKRIENQLPLTKSGNLKSTLSRAVVSGACLLDLEQLSVDEFRLFACALKQSKKDYIAGGSASWNRPDFFDPFVKSLEELIRLCDADSRI